MNKLKFILIKNIRGLLEFLEKFQTKIPLAHHRL